jgi:hypothetical protein
MSAKKQGRSGGASRVTHRRREAPARGLPIKEVPLTKILSGSKTWEIRSRATTRRGPIALIQSGTGTVVGTCRIVDCVGPFTVEQRRSGWKKAGFPRGKLLPAGFYAWVIEGARRLRTPVPYSHPRGAIIWVKLAPAVTRSLPAR